MKVEWMKKTDISISFNDNSGDMYDAAFRHRCAQEQKKIYFCHFYIYECPLDKLHPYAVLDRDKTVESDEVIKVSEYSARTPGRVVDEARAAKQIVTQNGQNWIPTDEEQGKKRLRSSYISYASDECVITIEKSNNKKLDGASIDPVGFNEIDYEKVELDGEDEQIEQSSPEDEKGSAGINIKTTDQSIINRLFEHFSEWSDGKVVKNKGNIYVLTSDNNGLSYSSVGIAKLPLIEDNYTEDVTDDYHYIVDNFNSPDPVGRIVLISGEPGTGKTHFIRSVLHSVNIGTFIMISPSMVSSLTGVDLMTFFIAQMNHMPKPIILVIEDADSCLVERSMDNLSAISGLLNVSDGIIGNLLDIRIIATTNADIKDIDEAILRPGRLLTKVVIEKLEPEHASRVYKRLSDTDKKFDKPASLAEIYFDANASGMKQRWKKNKKQSTTTAKMGFGS